MGSLATLFLLASTTATPCAAAPNSAAVQESRSTRIVGRVESAAGDLLVDGWGIVVVEMPEGPDGRRGNVVLRTSIDAETGQLQLDDLVPGTYALIAEGLGVASDPVTVELWAGAEESVVLRYDGPNPQRMLHVRFDSGIFRPLGLRSLVVDGVGADGERFPLRASRLDRTLFQSDEVEPGVYRVEVLDRRFEEQTIEGVRPGTTKVASLVGSAALEVHVVDSRTGEALDDYELDLTYEDARRRSFVHPLRRRGQPIPRGGVYAGLVADNVRLEARFPDRPPVRLAAFVLEGGEPRSVTLVSSRGERIEGRVEDAAGAPLADVEVQVTRGPWPGHDDPKGRTRTSHCSINGSSFVIDMPYRTAATQTDEEGRFSFEGLGAGQHVLFTELGPYWNVVQRIDVAPGIDEPFVLQFAKARPVRLRVLVPDGRPMDDLFVRLYGGRISSDYQSPSHPWRALKRGVFPDHRSLDESTAFEPVMLPEERWEFSLLLGHGADARSSPDTFASESVNVEVGGSDGSDPPLEVVFDVRESLPTPIEVRVPRLTGEDAWSLTCALFPRDEFGRRNTCSSASTDDRTTILNTLVGPGSYDLVIGGEASCWRWPEPIETPRGGGEPIVITPDARWVTLRLVDADGQPRAHTALAAWQADDPPRLGITDDEGRVVLLLGDGALELGLLEPTVDVERLRRQIRSAELPQLDLSAVARVATRDVSSDSRELVVRLKAE